MKLLVLLCALTAQIATAATVSIQVTNDRGSDSNLVTTEGGTKLHSGIAVAAIGTFSSTSITDFSTFTQVGAAVPFVVTTSTETRSGMFYKDLAVDLAAVGVNEKDVYIVIGNNPNNIKQSTSWLVYKTGLQFSDIGPTEITLVKESGTLIKGEIGRYKFKVSEGEALVEAYNLVNIPEPSSAVLLGLGGLALIIRRQR